MIFLEFTDSTLINYFASIFFNLSFVLAPIYGALSLTRH